MTRRHLLVLGSTAVSVMLVAGACGQKAAPDIDPPTKNNAAAVSSTTSIATTTTIAPTTTTTDPGTLPQTNDKPDTTSPELKARIELLWHAIVTDDTKAALPAFFPLTAYQQVKDLKDPTTDWNNRLVAAYNREISAYHKQLETNLKQQKATEATFVSLDVPAKSVQWINPNVEYNKIGYFRVFDSKLNYTINGKPFSFNVKSLISWRGQFYVVHLTTI